MIAAIRALLYGPKRWLRSCNRFEVVPVFLALARQIIGNTIKQLLVATTNKGLIDYLVCTGLSRPWVSLIIIQMKAYE